MKARSRNGKDENLIGNTYACKRLEMLQVGFAMGMVDIYCLASEAHLTLHKPLLRRSIEI